MELKDYTVIDFKNATAALLPPGEYWQYPTNKELSDLLNGIAEELKTTHDQTTQPLLYEKDNSLNGWRLTDYQTILNNQKILGIVYDDPIIPNLIYIGIQANQNPYQTLVGMDSYRLPHTAFCFKFQNKIQKLHVASTRQSLQINKRTIKNEGLVFNHKQVLYVACSRLSLQINRHTLRA